MHNCFSIETILQKWEATVSMYSQLSVMKAIRNYTMHVRV